MVVAVCVWLKDSCSVDENRFPRDSSSSIKNTHTSSILDNCTRAQISRAVRLLSCMHMLAICASMIAVPSSAEKQNQGLTFNVYYKLFSARFVRFREKRSVFTINLCSQLDVGLIVGYRRCQPTVRGIGSLSIIDLYHIDFLFLPFFLFPFSPLFFSVLFFLAMRAGVMIAAALLCAAMAVSTAHEHAHDQGGHHDHDHDHGVILFFKKKSGFLVPPHKYIIYSVKTMIRVASSFPHLCAPCPISTTNKMLTQPIELLVPV